MKVAQETGKKETERIIMTRKIFSLLALLPAAICAQNGKPLFPNASAPMTQPPPSAFDLHPVVKPDMNIGGHLFTKDTTVYRAALNNDGDFVFSACCEGGRDAVAIFTSRRMVAKQGDVIDGHIIASIPSDSAVAINNQGKVAYEAWYVDDKASAALGVLWYLGIFVDDRLALTRDSDTVSDHYVLTDEGDVVLQREAKPIAPAPAVTAPAPQKKPGLFDRIQINPPKIPRGLPITVAPAANKQQPVPSAKGFPDRPALPDRPLSVLGRNRQGQMLIPVNLHPDGFMVLLATPLTH
jgi:hypothetical protein